MAVPKNDTHKDYVRYAEHCLKMVLMHQIRNIAMFNARWRPNG